MTDISMIVHAGRMVAAHDLPSIADGALAVRFDGVGFDYGDDQPVLGDVTLAVGAGRSVGIVGRTGSGKTTFSRLVLRLVESTEGTVALGGVPIAQIPLAELRRRVAMVPQEVELFGATIRENVTLFDPTPTDDEVVAALNECVEAVHMDGGLAGTHCCGNTEWSILIDAGVDIVNFDAFEFGETIAMYADDVKGFLAKGGILAWGVVPTSPIIREQTCETLCAQLEKVMDHLAATGIDKQTIVEQAIVTPSCGTGSMDEADAERVFDMVQQVSTAMKAKYGF